ncbi:hypothetical protein J1N35_029254 [Gossypium stocksii]|uniref:Uncharacterized protein n=1 Tax=Gossypium stocksii TaxID=47602 RepID=A0A9D3ZT62_9ROSI|nr:hypothetical protein J1N35_029254 [Gossypium stocksii]
MNDQNYVFKPGASDTLKWIPPKEGGQVTSLLSFRVLCIFQVCDNERFFASKWPDLRTNHLQEGGYDANQVASCYDPTPQHRDWLKLEGPKCKMRLLISVC